MPPCRMCPSELVFLWGCRADGAGFVWIAGCAGAPHILPRVRSWNFDCASTSARSSLGMPPGCAGDVSTTFRSSFPLRIDVPLVAVRRRMRRPLPTNLLNGRERHTHTHALTHNFPSQFGERNTPFHLIPTHTVYTSTLSTVYLLRIRTV